MKRSKRISHIVPLLNSSSKGYSLLELIIVMALFMGIIIISSQAFNSILSLSTQQIKSSESDTQGIIGLEMLRVDLEHAGYGLPWVLGFVASFNEVASTVSPLAPGVDPTQFNDANNGSDDTNKVARAVQAATSTTDGRDYLVIKSTLVGMSDTAKKWAYIEGIGVSSHITPWESGTFEAGERVISIDSRTKRLIGINTTPSNFFYTIATSNMTPPATFQPQQDTDVFVVYGVAPAASGTYTDLRVPYNRVDYYVKRPASASDIPARCATGTGILYKAVMNHDADGSFTSYPLIECVADMQVIFALDTNGDGGVDLYLGENGLTALSAKEIRTQLKEIFVYIVAQEGGKDRNYTYPQSSIVVGEYGSGRTLDLNAVIGSDYKYYRWKTYKLSVTPKNINY